MAYVKMICVPGPSFIEFASLKFRTFYPQPKTTVQEWSIHSIINTKSLRVGFHPVRNHERQLGFLNHTEMFESSKDHSSDVVSIQKNTLQ
jgi:hypothetical protein